MHGSPQQINDIDYGTDGRQDGQSGIPCPSCRKFIYYTLQDALESLPLNCSNCNKTFATSMTDPTGKPIKIMLPGGGTHIFIEG